MGSRCWYRFRQRGQSPFVPLIITAIFGTSAVVSRLTDAAAVLTTVLTAYVGWLRTFLSPDTISGSEMMRLLGPTPGPAPPSYIQPPIHLAVIQFPGFDLEADQSSRYRWRDTARSNGLVLVLVPGLSLCPFCRNFVMRITCIPPL